MNANLLYRTYARLFARPALMPLHRLMYRLSLRGMGILNSENDFISGEAYFLKYISAKSPKTIVDVGANEGQFAQLCLLHTEATVFSFEPHPRTFQKLKSKIANSRWKGFECGLGSTPGSFILYDHAGQNGTQHASFQKGVFDSVHLKEFDQFEVQVRTLDEVAATTGLEKIDLLKIDVEGFEFEVLKGASHLLKAGKINMIMFEFNSMNIANNVSLQDFEKLLPDFSFYRLLPNSLLPLQHTSILFKEIYAFQNIFAIRHPA